MRYVSWSGGKDSTASIILAHERGIKIDGVVFAEVMFDHKRGISGENPKHIEWVYKDAVPILLDLGFKVFIVKSESDYMQEFYRKLLGGNKPERKGKCAGFFIGGMCGGNDRLKMRPLRKFFRDNKCTEQIVGIAADEPKRLARLKPGRRSLLAEYGIKEIDTYEICKRYNLLSPLYDTGTRGGCWFCPNQSIREFARLKKEYPALFEELRTMANCPNKVSENFKYGMTFFDVEKKIDALNSQISFFD